MNDSVKWIVIENIITLVLIGLLFWFTNSFWCFLLMLNLSTVTFKN